MTQPPPSAAPPDPATQWPRFASELAQCMRFYSRLPVPRVPGEADPHAAPDFTTVVRVLPIAGAIINCTGALALGVALWLGLPSLAAATIAVAVLVLATGAFHEDGLADVADGFGGGHSVARKLEIMRDSGIGAYGGVALVLSIVLRLALLAALAERSGAGVAALALIASGAVSRAAGLVPVWALPNARTDGKSASVGRPTDRTMVIASLLALGIGLLLLVPSQGVERTVLAIGLAALVALPVCRLSRRMIGGQTGDVAGATTQLADLMLLMVLVARPDWG
jgi:adenosylcobinamide-GDP ribazoletransferase